MTEALAYALTAFCAASGLLFVVSVCLVVASMAKNARECLNQSRKRKAHG